MQKLKKNWPLFFILFVWFLFSFPYLFLGKVPFPSNYLVSFFHPWSSYYGEIVGAVKNNATPDVVSQLFPWKSLVIESLMNGHLPLWNPYSFSGTPLLANYQSAVFSPLNLLYFILPFVNAWSVQILLQPLLAALFMYLFTRSLKLSEKASLVSSISFMFCGFITTWMMYGTLGYAILFLPLALFAIEKFYENQNKSFALLITLSIPLSFFSGHFQTSIYFLIFVCGYSIFKLLTTKDRRTFIFTIFLIFFGVLICMPQLLPSMEFYFLSVRSGSFLKSEVIPWGYLPTFLAPDFFGNPVTRNAWFGHYAEWNGYLGLVPFILAFYGFKKNNRYILFFAIAAVISLCLAFNTPVLDLLIALKIPVLSTSAASRVIVIFSFSAAILAGFGFDQLMADVNARKFKKIIIWIFSFAAVFAVLWIIVVLKLFIPKDEISISLSNLKLPSILFVFSALVVLAGVILKNKKVLIMVSVVLLLITTFDSFRFVTKWQPFDPGNLVYPEVGVTKFLKSHKGYDRAYGAAGQEFTTMTRVPGIEGYDPLYIARYGELVAASVDARYHIPESRSLVLLAKRDKYTGNILNLLGVKYLIDSHSDGHAVWNFPYWTYPADQFKTIFSDNRFQVFENERVLPRVIVASGFTVDKNSNDILNMVVTGKVDLSKTALLEEQPSIAISNNSGSAAITSYTPNKIEISVKSDHPAILVLTDLFYPGWKVYVNQKQEKILRADYAFRAAVIPKGESSVVFVFDPDSLKFGLLFAGVGAIGFLITFSLIKKRKNKNAR